MKKSLFAAAVLASLGALAAPASAAPGMIGAVDPTTNVVDVRMDGMHGRHRMMGHGHMRGRHMMRGHMMRHHMGRHHRM